MLFTQSVSEEEIQVVSVNLTELFVWGSEENGYYKIYYPKEGWNINIFENPSWDVRVLNLSNERVYIHIPFTEGRGLGDAITVVSTDESIGKHKNIIANKKEYIYESDGRLYGLQYNIPGWTLCLDPITSKIKQEDIFVFEEIVDSLEIASAEDLK